MSGIKDNKKIDEMRQRLYERGSPPPQRKNHSLTDVDREVPTAWQRPKNVTAARAETTGTPRPVADTITPPAPPTDRDTQSNVASSQTFAAVQPTTPMTKKPRRSYRLKLFLLAGLFFVGALVISSMILVFGNNSISGENISISVTGPFTVGGGEVMPVQIGITNGNAVPIESATLLIEYPRGAVAATEAREPLFAERMSLETIASGETINIPLRAVVFGEENEEQVIKASIEYRISDSNGLFFKEAEPLRFKISSSPVTVTADVLKKVSSGQQTTVEITIASNAPSTLSDVLVQAEYPVGFEYVSADPQPTQGNNGWLIKDLLSESEQTIAIKGIVIGKETDEYAINFTVGVPEERNSEVFASVFSNPQTEFKIEQPFVDLVLQMGNSTEEIAVIDSGNKTQVSLEIINTLSDSLYDLVVDVELGGNALSDLEVGPPTGFYDSANNTITWDISNVPELEQLAPGETARVAFVVEPASDVSRTPEISVSANVRARRVSESQVAETLVGTAAGKMRVESNLVLSTEVSHDSGLFSPIGNIPPEAEKETSYTITLLADNGANDVTDMKVTATLPSYVTWKDQTSGTGQITYDKIKRQITWQPGNIDANAAAIMSFQVGLIPSVLQIRSAPTLIQEQTLTAQDRFTETTLRSSHFARTTEMSTESGYEKGNGTVQP